MDYHISPKPRRAMTIIMAVLKSSFILTLGELICNKLNCVKPRIICLCGSTRFTDAYTEARRRETIAGHIVLSSDVDTHNGEHLDDAGAIKYRLDMLHLSKIDLADEVLVLNVNRYIGNSTRLEILYAQALNKPLRYLETD